MIGVGIRGVTKSYGALPILRGIDLTIDPGEFVVLLGPSGCGKSTLLNIVAGLEPLDDGAIEIAGEDMTHADPSKRHLAMVFQSYALFPTMSVRQNLGFGMRINRVPKAEIVRRVQSVAALLQIEPLLDRKPAQLSGGQRQRVAIGRALVRSTRLCLFDEPLSNLDAQLRADMRVELRRLHADLGSTMIYVTHDQVEAMTLASRVAVMNRGKVEQVDTPQKVYDRPATLFVARFVGSPAINLLEGVLMADRRFRSATGATVDLSGYAFASTPRPGTEVVLGVRPDDVRVAEAPARRGDALSAVPAFTESLGPRSLLWLELDGQRWSMYVDAKGGAIPTGPFEPGFDAADASLFDKTTGVRL